MTRHLKVSEVRKLYGERELAAGITAMGDVEVFELIRKAGHRIGCYATDRTERLAYLRNNAHHVATRISGSRTWWVLSGEEWCQVNAGKHAPPLPFDLAEKQARR